jgi:hypothetical protein
MKQGGFMKDMKQIWVSALIIGLSLMILSTVEASEKKCQFKTNDVGTINGRGPSSDAALEDAITQCFERHEKLHQMRSGTDYTQDQEAGVAVIDVCANPKCG